MGGNALDSAAVRKLEKLPTKTQMITSVAIMIKKVRIACYVHPCYPMLDYRTAYRHHVRCRGGVWKA